MNTPKWFIRVHALACLLGLSLFTAFLPNPVNGQSTQYWTKGGDWSAVHFSTVSATIGGSLLLLGACATQVVSLPGVLPSMTAVTSPSTYPGLGVQWQAMAGTDQVTVYVCAIIASVTPISTTYSVKVLR